jgi:hypothetical protein
VGPHQAIASAHPIRLRDGHLDLELSTLGTSGRPGSWGTGIAADEDKLTLLKLALLHYDNLLRDHQQYPARPATAREAISQLSAAGKTSIEAVAQYLACLWADAQPHLSLLLQQQRLGPEDVHVRFVFGIPAVWDDSTVMRMKEAITQSRICAIDGIPLPASMSFIAEPEAAAIAMIPGLAQRVGLQVCHTQCFSPLPRTPCANNVSIAGRTDSCDLRLWRRHRGKCTLHQGLGPRRCRSTLRTWSNMLTGGCEHRTLFRTRSPPSPPSPSKSASRDKEGCLATCS